MLRKTHQSLFKSVQINLRISSRTFSFSRTSSSKFSSSFRRVWVIASLISRLSSSWSWSKADLISSGLRHRW